MKNLLICGHRSFVATGLTKLLEQENISYDCFSRGEEEREGHVITGNVFNLAKNDKFDEYETVVNFILLKDKSVEENIKYIQSLLAFCKVKKVKSLLQISSISVYPNDAKVVDENTEIEKDYHNKGGYASIKVAVDHYLMDHPIEGLKIAFIRPGYIYTKNHKISKAGILIPRFGLNVLLGDEKTTLPLICREVFHQAILRIIQLEKKESVYLILNNDHENETKYNFVRNQWNIKPICLPYNPIMFCVKMFYRIGIFKYPLYMKFVGLFKRTWFNSKHTEKVLGMDFGKRRIAVLGAGTYGSYIANLLSIVYPHEKIDLYDVGNEHIKDEKGIGYLSHITNAPYEGLQKGRFFGYGGASTKWGGQLLTFTDNDFSKPNEYLRGIISIDKKYKDKVLSMFNIENKFTEERINKELFTKTGVWLSYFHRNLFKYFGIKKNRKIHLIPNSRITLLMNKGKHITGFEYISGRRIMVAHYDQYFLATGAFESSRLLVNSGLSKEQNFMSFSDHLSQRAFKVKSGIKMGNVDFRFHVKGASLITKRFIGEVDGYSFYSQPICNEDFSFFKDLKQLLFGHKFKLELILNIFKNIPQCILFAWYVFVLKKMYIYKNEFYLQIDIEAPRESGKMTLDEERDKYGEKSIDVDLSILPKTGELFTKARIIIKNFLDENGVVYEELPFSTHAEKYEDVYHPFGMFCDFKNIDDYFYCFDNMLVANTGILPRAGGINSTCSVLPLVEEYINNRMI
jgi:nucleoside-diphosphate-sugar epimerase